MRLTQGHEPQRCLLKPEDAGRAFPSTVLKTLMPPVNSSAVTGRSHSCAVGDPPGRGEGLLGLEAEAAFSTTEGQGPLTYHGRCP